jgi:MFS family permease
MPQEQPVIASGWRTLAILSGLGLITIFGETMVQPALPNFVKDFRISYETSSWILSTFLIAGAVMTPIGGKLSDIYGKKRILLIVMSVYCVGVLAAGFATSIAWMLAARVAMGVGFAAFPIAFGIIRESLPPSKLGIGQTVFGSTFSLGAVIGLVLGAGIIQTFGWHFAFFAVFPFALLLTLIVRQFIRGSAPVLYPPAALEGVGPNFDPTKTPLDLKGIFFLTVTVVSFLTGISLVQNVGGGSGVEVQIVGLLAVSAVALVLLVVVERRVSHPLVDIKLLTDRTILSAIVILMVVGTSTFMVYQTIPFLVQSPQPLGFGGDKLATAAVLLPFTIVSLIGTIGSGFILNRLGNLRMTAIGTALSTAGFFGLFAFHSTESLVVLMLAVIAAGLSFAFTGGFNIVIVSSPMQSMGIALGMTLLLNLVAQSIGPTVAATFQQLNQGSVAGVAGTFPTEQAYYLIFLTAAVLSLVSIALALSLAKRGQVAQPFPPMGAPQGPI